VENDSPNRQIKLALDATSRLKTERGVGVLVHARRFAPQRKVASTDRRSAPAACFDRSELPLTCRLAVGVVDDIRHHVQGEKVARGETPRELTCRRSRRSRHSAKPSNAGPRLG
jgi:hypothetical protein